MTKRTELVEITAQRLDPEAWGLIGDTFPDDSGRRRDASLKQAERILPVMLTLCNDFDSIKWAFQRTPLEATGMLPSPADR